MTFFARSTCFCKCNKFLNGSAFGTAFSTLNHFYSFDKFPREWLSLQSVTHFWKCDSIFYVWGKFARVARFCKYGPFMQMWAFFFKCNSFFKVWPNFYAWSNCQSVAQFLNVAHFSKCYRFYVLPRAPSKCNPLFTCCPFLQLYDLFFFGWPRHTCYLFFTNFVDFWGKGKGIPQDPRENLDIL